VTRLKKMMLEELQRRNYAQSTVKGTCGLFGNSPNTSISRPINSVRIICASTGPPVPGQKTRSGTVQQYVAPPLLFRQDVEAILSGRRYPDAQAASKTARGFSPDEVAKLIDFSQQPVPPHHAHDDVFHGMRRAELCR